MCREHNVVGSMSLLAIGSFGSAVRRYLESLGFSMRTSSLKVAPESVPSSISAADIHVLASWRPYPDLCEELNLLCANRKSAFLPVVLDSPYMRIGPVYVPGESGCFLCWGRRQLQHSPSPSQDCQVSDFYAHSRDKGPRGYLDAFAGIAAARVASTLRTRRTLLEAAGSIWRYDIFSGDVSSGSVVGVNGCAVCGLVRHPADQSYREMRTALGYLWDVRSANERQGQERTRGGADFDEHSV